MLDKKKKEGSLKRKYFRHYYIVSNYPQSWGLGRKIIANIFFFVTAFPITHRKHLLSRKDRKRIQRHLQPGDILLVGNMTTILSLFMQSHITHSSIVVSSDEIIDARANGVQKQSYKDFISSYDTAYLLRIPKKTPKRKNIIEAIINHAESLIGKPYDFFLSSRKDRYICTQVVKESYEIGGYPLQFAKKSGRVLYPRDFLKIKNIANVFQSRVTRKKTGFLTPFLWVLFFGG